MRVVQMEPVCKFGWATVMQQFREFFADGIHQLLHQWDVYLTPMTTNFNSFHSFTEKITEWVLFEQHSNVIKLSTNGSILAKLMV
jgi:5'(3')-deoxyribonucleotidase